MVTLTQPTRPGSGPVAGPSRAGTATGGERLADAVHRLDASDTALRRSGAWVQAPPWVKPLAPIEARSCPAGTVAAYRSVGPTGHTGTIALTPDGWMTRARDAWASAVVAEIRAVEATQRSPRGRLRWHVHQHTVLAVAPGLAWDDVARWVVDRWLSVSDGSGAGAQRARRIEGWEIEKQIRQTIKYPGKISDMTAPGMVEFIAVWKGRKPVQVRGALHGSSRIAALSRGHAEMIADLPATADRDVAHPIPLVDQLASVMASEIERDRESPVAVGEWQADTGAGWAPVDRADAPGWSETVDLEVAPYDLALPVVRILGIPAIVARGVVGIGVIDGAESGTPGWWSGWWSGVVGGEDPECLGEPHKDPPHFGVEGGPGGGGGVDHAGDVDRGFNLGKPNTQGKDRCVLRLNHVERPIVPLVGTVARLDHRTGEDLDHPGVGLDHDRPPDRVFRYRPGGCERV
jgi:hypothetical protein